jgi:hypothetical protein
MYSRAISAGEGWNSSGIPLPILTATRCSRAPFTVRITPRHLGRDPTLVQEDLPLRIDRPNAVEVVLAQKPEQFRLNAVSPARPARPLCSTRFALPGTQTLRFVFLRIDSSA